MQKICVNKEDNMVNQIFNIDEYPEFNPVHYSYCYVIDDENHEITHYGYRYNKETKKFELVDDYVEPEIIIEDSINEKLAQKDEEILNLKLTIADITEQKDEEILSLKLAIAEIVEGGI